MWPCGVIWQCKFIFFFQGVIKVQVGCELSASEVCADACIRFRICRKHGQIRFCEVRHINLTRYVCKLEKVRFVSREIAFYGKILL